MGWDGWIDGERVPAFSLTTIFLSPLSLSHQNGEKLAVMTGAKPDDLEKLIDENL